MQPSFLGFARLLSAIEQAMNDYRHMAHDAVTIEHVTVLSYTLLAYGLVAWHIDVEGVEISIWECVPVTSITQALQVA